MIGRRIDQHLLPGVNGCQIDLAFGNPVGVVHPAQIGDIEREAYRLAREPLGLHEGAHLVIVFPCPALLPFGRAGALPGGGRFRVIRRNTEIVQTATSAKDVVDPGGVPVRPLAEDAACKGQKVIRHLTVKKHIDLRFRLQAGIVHQLEISNLRHVLFT